MRVTAELFVNNNMLFICEKQTCCDMNKLIRSVTQHGHHKSIALQASQPHTFLPRV